MSKIRKNIYDLLRGSFLTDESAFKNWRIIFLITGLLLIMISSAHSVEKKVIQISELNKKKKELRETHVKTGIVLVRMKMESNVRKKAKAIGLLPSAEPPKKIKVIYKK